MTYRQGFSMLHQNRQSTNAHKNVKSPKCIAVQLVEKEYLAYRLRKSQRYSRTTFRRDSVIKLTLHMQKIEGRKIDYIGKI